MGPAEGNKDDWKPEAEGIGPAQPQEEKTEERTSSMCINM